LVVYDFGDSYCYGRLWASESERENVKIRGIVYGCVISVIGVLQIISTLRAALTDPGGVPKVNSRQNSRIGICREEE
jgi:hypothetical protein